MYEVLDHPADLLVRVRAPTLASLFEEASRGLFELRADLTMVHPDPLETVTVETEREDDLLVEWLSELLSRADALDEVHVQTRMLSVGGTLAEGELQGERYDPSRHELLREIKAVTYHGGRIRTEGSILVVDLILDI